MKIKNLFATICAAIVLMTASMSFAATQKTFSGVININTATVEQLTELPGIGPAKAMAIVEYRKTQNFSKKDELLLVKGIGEKLYAQLEPYVDVQGPDVRPGATQNVKR